MLYILLLTIFTIGILWFMQNKSFAYSRNLNVSGPKAAPGTRMTQIPGSKWSYGSDGKIYNSGGYAVNTFHANNGNLVFLQSSGQAKTLPSSVVNFLMKNDPYYMGGFDNPVNAKPMSSYS